MNEDQTDEQEVLLSIYEDDENFKQVSDTVYCYKFVCDENDLQSFMIQVFLHSSLAFSLPSAVKNMRYRTLPT